MEGHCGDLTVAVIFYKRISCIYKPEEEGDKCPHGRAPPAPGTSPRASTGKGSIYINHRLPLLLPPPPQIKKSNPFSSRLNQPRSIRW